MSYFICEACNCKWFQPGELKLCPRCGTIAAGENIEAPWTMWAYDPKAKTTVDGHDIVRRTDLEEAADRLWKIGIRNQRLLLSILAALSGLDAEEVRFTLELCYPRQ
jgi:hypothetical protein